jgi:hypothetical protein
VKVPRFRIAWLMIAVAFAALNFGAIRVMFGSPTAVFLVLGALPMVNILAVGILIGTRRPGSRPFLLGFVAFGAMALALYVILAVNLESRFPIAHLANSYLRLLSDPMEKIIGRNRPFVFVPIVCFGTMAMLVGPQVVFALIGGYLSRRFKITITPR